MFAVAAESDDHTEISICDVLFSLGKSDFATRFVGFEQIIKD